MRHAEDILTLPQSVFKQENEFDLHSPYKHGDRQKPLGNLFKVKSLLKTQLKCPLVARVINFKKSGSATSVQTSVIEGIFKEAIQMNLLGNKYLLPIEGMIFNRKTCVMHIFYPEKVSLYEYLHESDIPVSANDKHVIAK